MNFDCIIIGGGISGLTCGIKCAEKGVTCAIISAGMSALHFSSGSIDLLGYSTDHNVVHSPFDSLDGFIGANPDHPYSKCGIDTIEQSLAFFKNQAAIKNLELYSNDRDNHFHVTTLGTLKPTYFSQKSVFDEHLKDAFSNKPKIAIINIEGFRDFYPSLTAANLKKSSLFKDVDIISGSIKLPGLKHINKNPHEFRSIDIGRIFDSGLYLEKIAERILKVSKDAHIVAMPAFMGIDKHNETIKKLNEQTGLLIYEIPTLPPSILGMRLDNALKSRFAELGGVFIAGDRVTKGKIADQRLLSINTQNQKTTELKADFFVLSTGSFFSGGMVSDFESIKEPVFDLCLDFSAKRRTWHSKKFFNAQSHPFLSFGVKTDRRLNPIDQSGQTIENLFATGAVLSNYDPIKEGTGGGVAISTGFFAANQIINLADS